MRSVREKRTGCDVLLLLLLPALTCIAQVRIIEGVERDIGFTEMDSTVLRTLERWFQSQLQHASQAAAASEYEADEADALFSLAGLHLNKGTYSAGEEPARRALKIWQRVKGADHKDMMKAKNLLAQLLQFQGKLDEARPLYTELLEVGRRTLGAEDKHTLVYMNNLAALLEAQGHLEEARPLLVDALEGKRRTLGPNHPSTLSSMNSLAALLQEQGHLEEARPLYVDALEGRRRTLGPNHPSTFTSMLNLATLLADVKERDEAAALLRECFEGMQRVLGQHHPHTIMCKEWMDHLGIQ
jgi:tetratricopeptide (TPR) repeat protein